MSLAAPSVFTGPGDDCDAWGLNEAINVADFPIPVYSRKQVTNAGKALLQHMPWSEDRADEYRTVFKIAYDWRSSHFYPMTKMRLELRSFIQGSIKRGVTAARLKRMSSIRKKLERIDANLVQIQDIGGCRAIVESQAALDKLLGHCRNGLGNHKLRSDRSYLDNPRESGYRSHHLVFDFQPENDREEPYRDRRVEVQLRSRIQHSWATAVEAIGIYRGEDLKAGEGNKEWLRFFQLVSDGFADFEGTGAVPGMPSKAERISELKDLNHRINALPRLDTLNEAFRHYDRHRKTGSTYYLMQFDNMARTLEVMQYDKPVDISTRYGEAEFANANYNTVMVIVDTLDALKEAYPNYFLDVRLFSENVLHLLSGEPLVMRSSPIRDTNTTLGYDVSWLRWHFPGAGKRR